MIFVLYAVEADHPNERHLREAAGEKTVKSLWKKNLFSKKNMRIHSSY